MDSDDRASRRRIAGAVVAALVLMGCADPSTSEDAASATPTPTEPCAAAVQQQIDDALAAFDQRREDALDQVTAIDLEVCPAFDRSAALAALRAEFEDHEALDGEELTPDAYGRLLGLALLTATLEPVPTYPVPEGFPEELPVVEGAELVESTTDGDAVSARWEVDAAAAGGYQAVADFYGEGLQQLLPDRWSVSSSSGGVTQDAGTVISGDSAFDVAGYGVQGTVSLSMPEGSPTITVDVTLRPEG